MPLVLQRDLWNFLHSSLAPVVFSRWPSLSNWFLLALVRKELNFHGEKQECMHSLVLLGPQEALMAAFPLLVISEITHCIGRTNCYSLPVAIAGNHGSCRTTSYLFFANTRSTWSELDHLPPFNWNLMNYFGMGLITSSLIDINRKHSVCIRQYPPI